MRLPRTYDQWKTTNPDDECIDNRSCHWEKMSGICMICAVPVPMMNAKWKGNGDENDPDCRRRHHLGRDIIRGRMEVRARRAARNIR